MVSCLHENYNVSDDRPDMGKKRSGIPMPVELRSNSDIITNRKMEKGRQRIGREYIWEAAPGT
jgi:hypothetical protein